MSPVPTVSTASTDAALCSTVDVERSVLDSYFLGASFSMPDRSFNSHRVNAPVLARHVNPRRASQITLTNPTPAANLNGTDTRPIGAINTKPSQSSEAEGGEAVVRCSCLILFAIVGAIIYGIYKKVHDDKIWAQEQADAAYQYALRVAAAEKAELDARVKGPEVMWEMLKEFKDFKVAILAEMRALRGLGASNSTSPTV